VSYLIDRRLNAKNKSTVNRQRFLHRHRKHIKGAVADAVKKRSITDMEKGEEIRIPQHDIQEPVFSHGPGGKRYIVSPGNKEFIAGDQIARPQGGGAGGAGGNASDQGDGLDEFVFQISQKEFLDFMFDDLELPNLVKKQLVGTEVFKQKHAGVVSSGAPNQINIVRSLRAANARRIALGSRSKKRLKELEAELTVGLEGNNLDDEEKNYLVVEIEKLKRKLRKIPFIDDFDLRYNLKVKEPVPTSKALMFCVMDVSGSMDQHTKDIAKRFFILLYMFLKRNYEKTEVIFIRHHTSAKEVDEEEFFYSRETGGTIVSSSLNLMHEIVQERYAEGGWNVYAAQASDGDNVQSDSPTCFQLLSEKIMPLLQHYSYIEITSSQPQSLWYEYLKVKQLFNSSFAMKKIVEVKDIYPVFRELFQRREV